MTVWNSRLFYHQFTVQSNEGFFSYLFFVVISVFAYFLRLVTCRGRKFEKIILYRTCLMSRNVMYITLFSFLSRALHFT